MPRFAVDAARSAEARPRAARSAAPSGVGAEMSPPVLPPPAVARTMLAGWLRSGRTRTKRWRNCSCSPFRSGVTDRPPEVAWGDDEADHSMEK